MKQVLLFLTCPDTAQAQAITDLLLDLSLAVCIKWIPTSSHFLWQGKKESAQEILLLIDTVEEHYDAIFKQIKTIHSYDTFVLQGVPITQSTPDVRAWITKELKI